MMVVDQQSSQDDHGAGSDARDVLPSSVEGNNGDVVEAAAAGRRFNNKAIVSSEEAQDDAENDDGGNSNDNDADKGGSSAAAATGCAADAAAAGAAAAAPPPPPPPSHISVFLRVRPSPRASPRLTLRPEEQAAEFVLPRDASAGAVNNTRERYVFAFDGVLTPGARQDEVFERAARPLVDAVLEGYNATLFAYGQTGSGKTFTIAGGAERYDDRGIAPRALAALYEGIAARPGRKYQVAVSYMEVYGDTGYDLLDASRDARALEDLPQVYVQEDEDGRVRLRNLTTHAAPGEEAALNLLFLGDTNRTISATPMNQASTRGHCVFTVEVTHGAASTATAGGNDGSSGGGDNGSAARAPPTVRRARLHLVDLAGSERVGKTGSAGAAAREARHINLSLHYLERVIVALQARARGGGGAATHVPYRDSLLTMVLRDALGGNCRTAMIATAHAEDEQLDESISTCRFAQRVACVANAPVVNEELDGAALVRALRREIRELKDEVALLHGGGPPRGPLTADERARLEARVRAFCDGGGGAAGDGGASGSGAAALTAGGDIVAIHACFEIMRSMLAQRHGGLAVAGTAPGASSSGATGQAAAAAVQHTAQHQQQEGDDPRPPPPGPPPPPHDEAASMLRGQVRRLRLTLQQRDAEIEALLVMLRRARGEGGGGGGGGGCDAAQPLEAAATTPAAAATAAATAAAAAAAAAAARAAATSEGGGKTQGPQQSRPPEPPDPRAPPADRAAAFEAFLRGYERAPAIERGRAALKARYGEAKALAADIGAARARAEAACAALEQRRLRRTAASIAAGGGAAEADAPDDEEEEQRLLRAIEEDKRAHAAAFERLRAVKAEVASLQAELEAGRARLQRDFAAWLEAGRAGGATAAVGGGGGGASSGGGAAGGAGASYPAAAGLASPSSLGSAATGDAAVDADVARFMAARAALLRTLGGAGASTAAAGGS